MRPDGSVLIIEVKPLLDADVKRMLPVSPEWLASGGCLKALRWLCTRGVSQPNQISPARGFVHDSVSRASAGFTLIEVIVALTILSLSLGIIYAGLWTDQNGRRAIRDLEQATMLAESKLNTMGIEEALREGRSAGRFDTRFRWDAVVAPYQEGGRDEAEDLVRPLVVTVTVSWGERGGDKTVSLSTLRLAPR